LTTSTRLYIKILYQEKPVEATKQKEGKRKKHEPEEQDEGMPQHRHCPLEKRRGDRNPKHHEEK
jgi:hypothetical protein